MTNAERAEAFTEEHEITGLVHLLTAELDAATQAAEERMREKCAKVALGRHVVAHFDSDGIHVDGMATQEAIAAAIRAIEVGGK